MTPNAKRVAAYQKRQSEKVARMKAALEEIGTPGSGIGLGWSDSQLIAYWAGHVAKNRRLAQEALK